MMDKLEILLPGEVFWTQHNRLTLFEIQDCINIMKISGRLGNCFWEEISDIHATNYSSIYNLTSRYINMQYPNSICTVKPTISFLQWIYNNLQTPDI